MAGKMKVWKVWRWMLRARIIAQLLYALAAISLAFALARR